VRQRDELRDKLFSDQAVKTYSGGKPNYTQPIEQEPVAYMTSQGFLYNKVSHPENYIPLYNAPPQREWVGLTGEELTECWNMDGVEFYKSIEAKLKEKNAQAKEN
jgi:hypothetical protein